MRFFKNISILCIIFVILFSISIKSLANDESYIWSTIETSTTPEKVNTSTVETNSEMQTMLVGEKMALTVGKGVVITLTGDLGAGKTHFVKGFAKGLGFDGTVTSPTFTLLNILQNKRFKKSV